MGRSLGYFDSEELDRPELNKCPECECYFASEECPLCGKVCPEAFRAGNRAAVKKPKKTRNSSGRVQFIPWYHTWWFILIMMYFIPIAGIVLFFTSPYSKKLKIIVGSIVVGFYVILGIVGLLLSGMMAGWFADPPVNDDLSREEYIATCQVMEAEQFYRMMDNEDVYACVTLTVKEIIVDQWGEYGYYDTYYLCTSADESITLLVRDCRLDGGDRLLANDVILVYGEGGGEASILTDQDRVLTHPCLNMAYSERIN